MKQKKKLIKTVSKESNGLSTHMAPRRLQSCEAKWFFVIRMLKDSSYFFLNLFPFCLQDVTFVVITCGTLI